MRSRSHCSISVSQCRADSLAAELHGLGKSVVTHVAPNPHVGHAEALAHLTDERARGLEATAGGDWAASTINALLFRSRYEGATCMKRIAQEAAEPAKAVAYMRTSSATNVGADKDSERRQRSAIEAYAKRAGMVVEDWFYDPAVSGADPIETRPGFSALLDRIEANGVCVVLIEDGTRCARGLVAQELGIV